MLLFYLNCKDKTRSSPTPCDFMFPFSPRHGGVLEQSPLAARQSCELSPAPKREMRETHWCKVRDTRRKHTAFGVCVFGWARLNQDVLDARKFPIPGAETQLVKIFRICQLGELSWVIKMPIWSQSSSGSVQESQRFVFRNCPCGQAYVGLFLPLKMAKANSRALRNSQDLITVRQNEYFHLNVVLCTQESANEMVCCAWLKKNLSNIEKESTRLDEIFKQTFAVWLGAKQ